MQKKTEEYIKLLQDKWNEARSLQNRDAGKRETWEKTVQTVNGSFPWNNPEMVMLLDFVEGSGYEGSGTIVGLTKDGRLVWDYQSHCSCNGFEDGAEINELDHEHILENKTFELRDLPVDWEEKVRDSIEKILVELVKT